MSENNHALSPPRVTVIADIESNAQALVDRVFKPAGIHAWMVSATAPPPDVLVVDVTQLRGDPLRGLRILRSTGEEAPAIVLAAHLSHSRLRDLFRLGVRDFLLKPYRPAELCQAVQELCEAHSAETNTQILSRRLDVMREQARLRSEEIRVLSEIGRVVVSLGDLDSILRRVVEAATFVTDAEEASIYLAEPGTDELVLRASKQAGERHATLKYLRVDDTVIGEIMTTGKPFLHQPSPKGGPIKVQTGFLVQSLIKVPIRASSKIIGVLGIYNRLTPRTFTNHHLTLLNALAHWAGVALEHAELLRQAESAVPASVPITAAPLKLIDGIDQAIETLEPLLNGSLGQVSEAQYQELRTLRNHLQELRSLPTATLHPEEAKEMIDLPGVLDQVVDELRLTATRRGLDLITEHGPTIPLFRGDRGRTRRVIETLVSAAIRRTTQGRIVLEAHRFEVQDSQSDSLPLPENLYPPDGIWAAVRVSDTSPGFSPDTIRALTINDIDPSSGQMGPGLSMGEIRMIVESMGGILWYEQTPASTTITFALPIT
ncbi:MAG: GAF domain-containing protein [Anaerolineales bacterium]|nr:MAG: GAF domain-containing protein [Anaerolineales bacterium]